MKKCVKLIPEVKPKGLKEIEQIDGYFCVTDVLRYLKKEYPYTYEAVGEEVDA